jgi:Protein of unknown function (DUF4238)
MLALSRRGAQIMGSMHWTLLEFARPWLATSDHPVVLWPLSLSSRQPTKSANLFEGGLLNTLEARFPVSPNHALLMTWLDTADEDSPVIKCRKETAANLNAFTVAEAEHQWFHLPGTVAPRAAGQLLPIAPSVFTGYSAETALDSFRRSQTAPRIQSKIGDGGLDGGFEILTMRRDGHTEIVQVAPALDDAAASGR